MTDAAPIQWWRRWFAGAQHAFAMPADEPLAADEVELLDRLAAAVRQRRLETPVSLLLESCRPMTFVGSQAARAMAPIGWQVLGADDWNRLAQLLERRSVCDELLRRIEVGLEPPVRARKMSSGP